MVQAGNDGTVGGKIAVLCLEKKLSSLASAEFKCAVAAYLLEGVIR